MNTQADYNLALRHEKNKYEERLSVYFILSLLFCFAVVVLTAVFTSIFVGGVYIDAFETGAKQTAGEVIRVELVEQEDHTQLWVIEDPNWGSKYNQHLRNGH